MKRAEAWALHLSMLLVGGTGLVYAWMRYLAAPDDPYAIVNHPWQPALQHLHIWTAPLLVFAAGLVWREHIWKHWSQGVRQGRRSGGTLLFSLAPMALSGYFIQTAVSDGWRQAWVIVHLATAALWTLGYAAHGRTLLRRLPRRARARGETAPACESAGTARPT